MKALNRSGDMVALAIVKVVPDDQLVKAETIKRVLLVVNESFPCLARCVEACSNRQPRLTLLLLDHLRDHSRGDLRKEVEVTRRYVLKETLQDQALSR